MASKEKRLSTVEKVILQAMGEDRTVGHPEDPAREKWPQLWEWLSMIYVGRDKMKAPALITIQLGPGGVIARLNDRDLAVSVTASFPHLEQLFDQFELLLNSPDIPIQVYGKKEPILKTRRQKS